MDIRIDRRSLVLLAALAGLPLLSSPIRAEEPALIPVAATEVVEDEWRYLRRPVIIFADTPHDPNFIRQMEMLPRVLDALALRDVLLVTDTDPAAGSDLRKRLRPRGFSLVIMDKDWGSAIRKPLPWDGREIVNAIDRMPIARSEALERNPAGR